MYYLDILQERNPRLLVMRSAPEAEAIRTLRKRGAIREETQGILGMARPVREKAKNIAARDYAGEWQIQLRYLLSEEETKRAQAQSWDQALSYAR